MPIQFLRQESEYNCVIEDIFINHSNFIIKIYLVRMVNKQNYYIH